jgi:hypothetical protein
VALSCKTYLHLGYACLENDFEKAIFSSKYVYRSIEKLEVISFSLVQ